MCGKHTLDTTCGAVDEEMTGLLDFYCLNDKTALQVE